MVIFGHLCRLVDAVSNNTTRRALSETDAIVQLTAPLFKPKDEKGRKKQKKSKTTAKLETQITSRLADMREILRFIVRCHDMIFLNLPPLKEWMQKRASARSRRVRQSVAFAQSPLLATGVEDDGGEDSEDDSDDEISIPYNALAVRTFTSEDPAELDLTKGDKVIVTKMKRDGWWEGHKRGDDSKKGVFPSTFVEITGRAETEGLDHASSFRKRLESQMKPACNEKRNWEPYRFQLQRVSIRLRNQNYSRRAYQSFLSTEAI